MIVEMVLKPERVDCRSQERYSREEHGQLCLMLLSTD